MPEKMIQTTYVHIEKQSQQTIILFKQLLTVEYNLYDDHLDEKDEKLFDPVRYLSPPSRESLCNGELRHEMRSVISAVRQCQ